MTGAIFKQRGAAILAALLIVAIVTATTAGLLYAQTLWMRESALAADSAQGRIAARAGIAWAGAILHQDARVSQIDHLGEPWTTPLPPTRVEGAEISGQIRDLQGRYNINNLVRDGIAEPREIARYKRLLLALGLPGALAHTAADWMDADQAVSGADGAEDGYYATLAQPYRTAGRPLIDLHELLRVKGYTSAVFATLAPYLTALPAPSAVNVNTAPPETLMLLADGLTLADARLLAAERERSYIRDLNDFRARLPASAYPIDTAMARVSSDYFLIEADVRYGSATTRWQAIVERGANPWPRVVWQRIGG
jgi:general secretion pathway protein K